MTDTPLTIAPATEAESSRKPKRLNAKNVRRRVSRIAAGTDPKIQRKKTGRLAISILEKIASGEISNPKAVALAFVGAPDSAETQAPVDEDTA